MVCNDTNTCGCEADFVALTDIMGQVVRCVEQNSTLSVGAQKKDSEEEIGNESMTHFSHQLLVNLASSDTNCL